MEYVKRFLGGVSLLLVTESTFCYGAMIGQNTSPLNTFSSQETKQTWFSSEYSQIHFPRETEQQIFQCNILSRIPNFDESLRHSNKDIEECYDKTCKQIIARWDELTPEEQVRVYRQKGTILWPMLNVEQQSLLRNSLLGMNENDGNKQTSELQKENGKENIYKKDDGDSYKQPDGTIVYYDGHWKTPDGITHYPDTSWKDQDGNVYPPHSYKDARGNICYNDGCWKDKKGLMHYRDGRIIRCSDGKLLRKKNPNGNKYYPDGSWEDCYGIKHYPNSNMMKCKRAGE